MGLIDFVKLIRPQQWYKNILIFVALFFSFNVTNIDLLTLTIFGFISLCLVSSSGYIINDIIDIKNDMKHPEKRKRPIASGKISIFSALLISFVFLIGGILLSYILGELFFYSVVILFIISILYSIGLKHEMFLDIIIIGVLFVIRAVSGALLIDVKVTPWFIVVIFFLALFLVIGKRYGDKEFMGTNAHEHKVVLKSYSKELLNLLMTMTITAMIVFYTLYCFLGHNGEKIMLIIGLPIVMYGIFRYLFLINNGSKITRHPDKMFTDARLVITLLLWLAVNFYIFYLV
ncbi:UbiA prenyltransferase family protein [Nanoarchaeota archaeon]